MCIHRVHILGFLFGCNYADIMNAGCATTFAVKDSGACGVKHDVNVLLVITNFDGELVCCRVSIAGEEEVSEVVVLVEVEFCKNFTACLGDFICAVFDTALTNRVFAQYVAKKRDDHEVIGGLSGSGVL